MASERDVAEWAADLPDEYLECRDYGHNWKPWAVRFDEEHNAYVRVARCGRCKSTRPEWMGMGGSRDRTSIAYRDGYLAPAGTGRLVMKDKDALRLESVTRQLNDPVLLRRGAQMDADAARKKGRTRG